ncbi:FkbM family methyltransferase [Spirosoma oryzicola]|uniref:FkbM family methyltransferase n=1 Tax=Spirosoma oryzicola TaxID=2898794 RepID=UPI001E5F7682|nr:FkbM family methyltransferase [Spirosoma oryzicola]UHG94046.1 FkbM family methyltransferase [Spirosoma oryzicola]
MNVYRKLRRFVAKQLGYLAAKMEPFSSQDDLSKFKGYYSDAVEDASTIRLTRNGHTITLRKASSDLMVFEQLFIYKEYSELVDLIRLNKISIRTVIDLGANIGLATIYLRENFPDATFICAEPDERNFESLQANLSGYGKTVLYQKAIWSTQKNIYLNRNFRDGKDWAIAVSNNKSGSYAEVNTMTIDEIILHNNLDEIDLIKIDIEGAEAELFKVSEQNDFLDKVKVIAIEIHNEFNVRDSIISQLINHNFLLVESKQTLVAISASCIQNSMNHVTNNQSVI